jgi:protein O-mannosyl-transferase
MSGKRRARPGSRTPEPPRSAASPSVSVMAEPERENLARPADPVSTRSKWAYAIVPVALAIVVSLNTLWNGWVADDDTQIVRNAQIQKLSNIPLSFTTSVWSYATSDITFSVDTYYRPIFMSLFTINYALIGLTPWAWHLINLLIHAAVTLLVFVTLKELTKQRGVAAIAAALFAVHPAHAESVAWVSGITDPLMALFLLPAFWFYLRFRESGSKYLFGVVALFYLLALFSKETALALPLLIAYCELFHFRELAPLKIRFARALLLPGLLVLPTAGYFLMRHFALSGALFGSGQRYPFGPALMTVPLALIKYIALMILPFGHSYQHYTEFVLSPATIEFLLPLAGIAILIVLIVMTRSRLLFFGAFWFIVMLAPALAAIRQFDREYLLQDRYLYLPSIGFCLMVALGIDWLTKRFGLKVGASVAAVLVIAYGAADIRQNRVWTDGITVFQNCVDTDPDSAEAHLSLGRVYWETGRVREGEVHARKALELAPSSPSPYLLLSYFARSSGKDDTSIEYLERGISAVREDPISRFKLATMRLNLGLMQALKNPAAAEENMLRSIEIWPRATAWYYTGQFYFDQGRYQEALSMFEQALDKVPRRYAQIHLRLGLTYDKLGQAENARASYQKYLELAPDAPDRAEVTRRLSQV